MAKEKIKTVYVCTNCGEVSPRWLGRCPSCGEWNTLAEDVVRETPRSKSSGSAQVRTLSGASRAAAARLSEISAADRESRIRVGISELDRVLGGGIVIGSVVLLGGEPGAGKSTLLLQMCGALDGRADVLYITGEESTRQIKLRALRLGVTGENITLAAETDIDEICAMIETTHPHLVIIDSIQTMQCSAISSSAGSVSQVKECTSTLMNVAKSQEIPTFIVGHVNKDGAIAGPKVMEHMFDMTQNGLHVVENPSQMLLEGRPLGVSGNCVACTMEGTRPLLSEVQALVTKSNFGTPRRASSGLDFNRVNLMIAVLEKRAGYFLGNLDVYLNIVGGMQLDDTACDLAICLAIVSGLTDRCIPDDLLAIGEVGLGGEVRSVPNLQYRLREAQRLGFTRAMVPQHGLSKIDTSEFDSMKLIGISSVSQAAGLL